MNKDIIRAFFAFDLAEDAKDTVMQTIKILHQKTPSREAIRWVTQESLHLTLCFLGNIELVRVPILMQKVTEAVKDIESFDINFSGVRYFPDERYPHTVVLLPEPEEPVIALAKAIEEGVVACGLETESRPFRPHLTLGRIKKKQVLSASFPVVPALQSVEVAEVILFQSLGQSQYMRLGHAKLQ